MNDQSTKPRGPSLNVLIWEDDVPFLQFLSDFIEECGHAVFPVTTRDDAESFLSTHRINALILDVYIRDNSNRIADNTLGLIQQIRLGVGKSFKISRHVPILTITGGRSLEGGLHALQIAESFGATDTLQKPFSELDLQLWLDKVGTEVATNERPRNLNL